MKIRSKSIEENETNLLLLSLDVVSVDSLILVK